MIKLKMPSFRFSFLLLLCLFFLLRVYPIWGGNFPYAYDNAKDSLALMQMWVFGKPPLLGAVTSMEGLWQGPFWYYILFPLNLLFSFHPVASVLTVIVLGGFTFWLFWKYLGKLEAFLYAVSSIVIVTHQTAWSPYLTMFSTAWILVILASVKKKITNIQTMLASFCFSLLFHAEIAFGFVFAAPLLVIFILRKIKLNLKQILIALAVFIFSFAPQAIFDLRHGFIEARSIIRFVANYNQEGVGVWENQTGVGRIVEVARGLAGNMVGGILPFNRGISESISIAILVLFGLVLILKYKTNKETLILTLPFIIGTFFFYLFLPFKSFYLVGLTPFWIYLFAKLLKKEFPGFVKPVVVLFLISGTIGMLFSRADYERHAVSSRILFEQKRKAVEAAYEITQGKPFNSYHFVPEVYDYTYQHIYQYTSLIKKRDVPKEYSYAPGEVAYMQTKKIVAKATEEPSYTILIVEKGENELLFSTWWNNLTRGKRILSSEKINDAISVYKLINEN